MSNSKFISQGGTTTGNPKGEYQTLENLQQKGFNSEYQLTTKPFNGILWAIEAARVLTLNSSNPIALYMAYQLDGENTLPIPYKPYRQTIPVSRSTDIDDIIKQNKNIASVITINISIDTNHFQAYTFIRYTVDEATWQLFILDDSHEEDNQVLIGNIKNSNHEYAEYKVNIDVYKMVERLINFSKGSVTTSAPIKLFEALDQVRECMNTFISGDYQQASAQCAALLTAAYHAFGNYDPDTTASQASLNPFVTYMILNKMRGEENYKKYYLNRSYNSKDNFHGNPLPNTVSGLMADMRRYNIERTDNNSDNLIKQGQKRSGNFGSVQVKENTNNKAEEDDQLELESEGIQRHKKRKLDYNKRRKAANNKKKIEQSAPTGRPIKEKDKSHNGHSPEVMEAIKKLKGLKKSKPLWNSEDRTKWINKGDKTGRACVKCRGTKYEFTHPTELCKVHPGKNAPTGRSKSPYTLDNAFDYEGWVNGKNGMDDSNSKDN